MTYIVIILYFLFLIYIHDIRKNKRNADVHFKVEAIIIILLYGLRYHIGADSFNYMDEYPHYPNFAKLSRTGFGDLSWQPGWYILNAAVRTISDEFWVFNLIHNLFVNTVVFVTINRFSQHRFSAVLAYFVCFSPYFCTEILRESIAVSFFLLGLPYLLKKKWVQYYIFALLAFSMHASSIFTFLLPPLMFLLARDFKIKHVIIFSIIIAFVSASITDYVIFAQQYLGAAMGGKLVGYYMSQVSLQESMTGLFGTGIPGSWIISLIFYPLYLYLMRKLEMESPMNNFILNMEVILNLFSYFLGMITERGANYFNLMFYVILIDLLYKARLYYRVGAKRIITVSVFVFFFLWLPYRYYFRMAEETKGIRAYKLYYPYSSILFPEKDSQREQLGDMARDS